MVDVIHDIYEAARLLRRNIARQQHVEREQNGYCRIVLKATEYEMPRIDDERPVARGDTDGI